MCTNWHTRADSSFGWAAKCEVRVHLYPLSRFDYYYVVPLFTFDFGHTHTHTRNSIAIHFASAIGKNRQSDGFGIIIIIDSVRTPRIWPNFPSRANWDWQNCRHTSHAKQGGAQCALLSLQYAKLAADCFFSAGPKQWLRILSSIYNPLMQLSLALWTSTRYPETYSGAATIQISGGYKLSAYTHARSWKSFNAAEDSHAFGDVCVCERPTLRHHNTGFIMSGGPQLGRMYHVVGCVRNSFGALANEINGKF